MIRHAMRRGCMLAAVVNLLATAMPLRSPRTRPKALHWSWRRRGASNISRLRYDLALAIPRLPAQPVTGSTVMRFRLADASKPLVIDFDAEGAPEATVTANGVVVPTRAVNGHLVIPAAPLRRGENKVRIDFRAGNAPLNRSADLLYTWFVPAQARRAMPCFDQPDLKGRGPSRWNTRRNGSRWPMAPSETGERRAIACASAFTRPSPCRPTWWPSSSAT